MKTSTKIILITAIVIIVAGTWAYREKTECLQKAKTENKISVPTKKTKTIYSGKKSKTIETVTSANGITEIISEENNISPEKHTAKKTTIIKSPDGKIISTRINTAETDSNTKKITDDTKSQYSRTIKIREEKNSENPKTKYVISTEKTIAPNGNIIRSSIKKTTITNNSDEKTTEKITTIDGKVETNEYTSTQGPNNTKDSITKSVTTQNGEVKRFFKKTSMGSKGLDTIFEETVSQNGKTEYTKNTTIESDKQSGTETETSSIKTVSPKWIITENIKTITSKDQKANNTTKKNTVKRQQTDKDTNEVTSLNRTTIITVHDEGGNKGKTIKHIINTITVKGKTINTRTLSSEYTTAPNKEFTRSISKITDTTKSPKEILTIQKIDIEDGKTKKHIETIVTIDGKTKKTVTRYYTRYGRMIKERTKTVPYKKEL